MRKKHAHSLVVARLLRYYDPFQVLELERAVVEERLFQVKVQKVFGSNDDTPEWDLGRIRFFWEQLDRGRQLDPIIVRAWDDHMAPHLNGRPVLLDGHHRLCAADLYGSRVIRVEWGGRCDVLEWLSGKVDVDPLLVKETSRTNETLR